MEHGIVFEPGVYISSILPGTPAAKEMNMSIGDRVLFVSFILQQKCIHSSFIIRKSRNSCSCVDEFFNFSFSQTDKR